MSMIFVMRNCELDDSDPFRMGAYSAFGYLLAGLRKWQSCA